jgi:hypothetical protein
VLFDVQNLALCLTREVIKFIDFKIMLKLQCKTTFNSAFVGEKNHQNRTRVDFWMMFLKNVVLYEIYSKKLQWPNTFCMSLYLFTEFRAFTMFAISCYALFLPPEVIEEENFAFKITFLFSCFSNNTTFSLSVQFGFR